nr:Arc family DNA-binding protein [Comamonas thiooxydans]
MEDDDLYTRITLRIPKGLHQRLSDQARATSKSLNAEIIGSLEESAGLRQQVGDLHRQMQVRDELLKQAQEDLLAKKQADKEQWSSDIDKQRQLWNQAELYRVRYRELATLFNAYYAVIESAIDEGKLDPDDLGAGQQVIALISDLLEQSEYRMVAEAVQYFLTGREHPVAAAAVKEAIDLLCKAAWHLGTHLNHEYEKSEAVKRKRPRKTRKQSADPTTKLL